MDAFRHAEAINTEANPIKITIASAPVIIENRRVLLDKQGDDDFWKFPGGVLSENETVRQNAVKNAMEELGTHVELTGRPFVMVFDLDQGELKEYFVLIHYLAKRVNQELRMGKGVRQYEWCNIDDLPEGCAPNIKPVLDYFARMW